MKWRRWLLASVAIIAALVTVHQVTKARRAAADTASVQAALEKYARELRPGLTRQEVVAHLKAKGVTYREVGIGGTNMLQIKVGEEDAPWYCSQVIDYVNLEFRSRTVSSRIPDGAPDDVLAQVSLGVMGEGCL